MGRKPRPPFENESREAYREYLRWHSPHTDFNWRIDGALIAAAVVLIAAYVVIAIGVLS